MPVCTAIPDARFPFLAEMESVKVALKWVLAYLGAMHCLSPKPAIVLDIDGTVLQNQPDGSAKCVLIFRELCKCCEKAGITIFCVTARPDSDQGYNRRWTESQLRKCGIEPVHELIMRPPDSKFGPFKKEARSEIRAKGYDVLVSIGDQWADLLYRPNPPSHLKKDGVYVGLFEHTTFGVKLPAED